MADNELKIEYIPVEDLKPYENNARKHGKGDIEAIAKSIQEFGFDDPVGIWGDENTIVEGHGRVLAAKSLGMSEVPCMRLDHLTDEQRRAYALAHNKTAELSAWDFGLVDSEVAGIFSIDMSLFGFGVSAEKENPYTMKVSVPHYEVRGDDVSILELFNDSKTRELCAEIETAEGITDDERAFLLVAAARHVVFNYRNIAEYYAKATPQCQRLMEKSALVIIDLDDAIANGYVKLSKRLKELADA